MKYQSPLDFFSTLLIEQMDPGSHTLPICPYIGYGNCTFFAMQHFFPPFSFSSFLCPFFFGVLFSERVRAPSPANQIGGGGRMRGRGNAGPISSYRCRRCWTHSMRFFGHIRYEGKTNIKKKKMLTDDEMLDTFT